MIEIKLNQEILERLIADELREQFNDLSHGHTFWDMKELCRQTCMSHTFIKQQFFYEKDFPKYRVGRKWLFPAKETEQFLLEWLKKSNCR